MAKEKAPSGHPFPLTTSLLVGWHDRLAEYRANPNIMSVAQSGYTGTSYPVSVLDSLLTAESLSSMNDRDGLVLLMSAMANV